MNEKKKKDLLKKETADKNFCYNRFLFLRYLLALFFFTNLYWGLALYLSESPLMLVPGLLLLMSLLAIMDHVKLYGIKAESTTKCLDHHLWYQKIQLLVNFFLLLLLFIPKGINLFFPFLVNSVQTNGMIGSICMLGIALSFWSIYRIKKIYHNQDVYYSHIKEFVKFQ